jgi:hypothetical protein
MLAETSLKRLLCVANVDMMTNLTSCLIDQEAMTAFATK